MSAATHHSFVYALTGQITLTPCSTLYFIKNLFLPIQKPHFTNWPDLSKHSLVLSGVTDVPMTINEQ